MIIMEDQSVAGKNAGNSAQVLTINDRHPTTHTYKLKTHVYLVFQVNNSPDTCLKNIIRFVNFEKFLESLTIISSNLHSFFYLGLAQGRMNGGIQWDSNSFVKVC